MNSARIYYNNGYWHVDFIDTNYEPLPAVGVFKELQQARQAALEWVGGVVEHVAIVGKSDR